MHLLACPTQDENETDPSAGTAYLGKEPTLSKGQHQQQQAPAASQATIDPVPEGDPAAAVAP